MGTDHVAVDSSGAYLLSRFWCGFWVSDLVQTRTGKEAVIGGVAVGLQDDASRYF